MSGMSQWQESFGMRRWRQTIAPGRKVCTANWEPENQSSQMKGQERGIQFTGACVQLINNRQQTMHWQPASKDLELLPSRQR